MNLGELFYKLNNQGKTFDEIGKAHGKTKGQVAGAIHRYKKANGITIDKRRREKTAAEKPVKKATKTRKRKSAIEKKPSSGTSEPLRMTLGELRLNECRYPYGDGPYTFCGRATDKGKSYCPEHQKICIGKPRKSKIESEFIPLRQWPSENGAKAAKKARSGQ